MQLKVRLYGTLNRRFAGYDHVQGMEVEIPEGGTAGDLVALLGISKSEGAVVAVEGRVLKADEKMPSGAFVNVFQAIHGG